MKKSNNITVEVPLYRVMKHVDLIYRLGLNPYCVNEGCDRNSMIDVSVEDCVRYNLHKEDEENNSKEMTLYGAFNTLLKQFTDGKGVDEEVFNDWDTCDSFLLQDEIGNMNIQPKWLTSIGVIEAIFSMIKTSEENGNIKIVDKIVRSRKKYE